MAEIIKMSCLQLNRKIAKVGAEYRGNTKKISFGDTIPEKAVSFVRWQNILVAGEVICPGVLWSELEKQGFITGCTVCIDGIKYLCRSLKVGETDGAPSEWDSILDDLGEDDDLWHWDQKFFWGQEFSEGGTFFHAVRGCDSARFRDGFSGSARSMDVGFRPVLEPLSAEPIVSNSLVGTTLQIYGPGNAFSGQLIEFSDYDLVIEPSSQQSPPVDCTWASIDGNRVIIDRTSIVWMQEVGGHG